MSDLINNLTYVEIPKDVAYAVGELFGYYLIPITACVASAINLTFCRAIVINSKFMRRRKYRLLLAKAFIVGLHGKLQLAFHLLNIQLDNFSNKNRNLNGRLSECQLQFLQGASSQHIQTPGLEHYVSLDFSESLDLMWLLWSCRLLWSIQNALQQIQTERNTSQVYFPGTYLLQHIALDPWLHGDRTPVYSTQPGEVYGDLYWVRTVLLLQRLYDGRLCIMLSVYYDILDCAQYNECGQVQGAYNFSVSTPLVHRGEHVHTHDFDHCQLVHSNGCPAYNFGAC